MATVFLDIEDFQTRRVVVGEPSNEITDTFWKNLHLKYTFPRESGTVVFDPSALTELPSGSPVGAWVTTPNTQNYNDPLDNEVLPKPVMYTTESGKLVGYALDFIVADPIPFQDIINPDIDNDGDDFIKRLEGGEITDANAGLTWEIKTPDGVALDPNKDEFKPSNKDDVAANNVFPSPFLLLGVEDIA